MPKSRRYSLLLASLRLLLVVGTVVILPSESALAAPQVSEGERIAFRPFRWVDGSGRDVVPLGEQSVLRAVDLDLRLAADDSSILNPIQWRDLDPCVETAAAADLGDEAVMEEDVSTLRFRDDLRAFPQSIGRDLRSMIRWRNGVVIGVGAALSAVSAQNWDAETRDWTFGHAERWGTGFNDAFNILGNPAVQGGLAGGLYATSLALNDIELHRFSGAVVNALLLTDLSVVILKYSFNTTRPDGGSDGFPSGHTASSFGFAAVVDRYYGWKWGVPAYSLATLVAWQRIDGRHHDLSDVLFGAALGYAIGSTVAERHLTQRFGVIARPFVEPVRGTSGVLFERRF